MKPMAWVLALGVIFALLGAAAPQAQANWGALATVSSTMGVNANRLCVGESTRGDIGCPTYAPTVDSAGLLTAVNISATGNISANRFIGDGSGLTGVMAGSTDRITSGTTYAIASLNSQLSISAPWIDISSTNELIQIGYNSPAYGVNIRAAQVGGWARYYGFQNASNQMLGGFGGYGAANNLTYTFVGDDYNSPTIVFERATKNVGIGTTAPSSKFHVKDPSGDLYTRFEGVSNVHSSKMYLSSAASGDGGMEYDANTNQFDIFSYGDMKFNVGTANLSGVVGNERMRITQAGTVGIGTATPSYSLVVATVSASGNTNDIGMLVRPGKATGGGSTILRVASVGYDGLYGAELESNSSYSNLGNRFGTYGDFNLVNKLPMTGNPFGNINMVTYNNNIGTIGLTVGGGSQQGKVGVATSLPSTTLHISGTLRLSDGGEACDADRAGAIKYASSVFSFCNGSAWQTLAEAAGAASIDRITSGTTAVVANTTGYISLTTGGSTTGYFDTSGRLIVPGISVTTNQLSATTGYFANKLSVGTSLTPALLTLRGNSPIVRMTNDSTTGFHEVQFRDEADNTKWSHGIFADAHASQPLRNLFYIYQYSNSADVTQNKYRLTINDTGNVGLGGVFSATTVLHVSGTLRLADGGEACDTNRAGAIKYASTVFSFCNGSAWQTLAEAAAGGSSIDSLTDAEKNLTTNNMFLGTSYTTALVNNTGNTATGVGALDALTDSATSGEGDFNTATGYNALTVNTTGYYNAAFGTQALATNTTGYLNTAMGGNALVYNTNGYHNTATGYATLFNNTTGINNTANGVSALFANTTGSHNTVMGVSALNAQQNSFGQTAIGYVAMQYISGTAADAALYNTAVGYGALTGGVTATNNTGDYNTALGASALGLTTTGGYNTASGYAAMGLNTTGTSNSGYGYAALYSNTTGNNNTALGINAARYIADGSTANTTGDFGVYLGSATKALADDAQNEIVIGYNATGAGSNTVTLGNSSITKTLLQGKVGVGIANPSVSLHLPMTADTGIGTIAAGRIIVGDDAQIEDFASLSVASAGDGLTVASGSTVRFYSDQSAGINAFISLYAAASQNLTLQTTSSGASKSFNIVQEGLGLLTTRIDGVVLIGATSSTNPSTTLHVSGTLRIANGGEACDANRAGAIKYASAVFSFCNGTAWQTLAAAAASGIDSITSGTTNVTANTTGFISLTTGGSTTGYFDTVGRLVVPGISVTTNQLSATTGYFSGNIAIGGTNPSTTLDIRATAYTAAGIAVVIPDNYSYGFRRSTDGASVGLIGTSGSGGNRHIEIGTGSGEYGGGGIRLYAGSVQRMIVSSTGNVGIGSFSPAAKLDVSGSILSRAFTAGSGTSIDFSQSNVVYTSAACGAFTLSNVQDGGIYTLVVTGNGTGPATFTHTGLTLKTNATLSCTAAKETVFTFTRANSNVYVRMETGY